MISSRLLIKSMSHLQIYLKDTDFAKMTHECSMFVVLMRIIRWLKYESGPKSSYGDVIAVVDDFFDQWDPSSATPLEDVCELLGD